MKTIRYLFLKIYPLKCFFNARKTIILVCKLYIFRAIDFKLGMIVDIITQHLHVHLQVSITLHNENMADFVVSYNKKDSKLSALWSVKYT